MSLIFWGISDVVLAVALQLLLWRLRPPRSSARGLALVFAASFVALFGISRVASGPVAAPGPAEWIYLACFHVVCLGVYLINFTMIEAESPSQMMVLAIEAAGEQGLPKETLSQIVHEDLFVKDRLRQLVEGGSL